MGLEENPCTQIKQMLSATTPVEKIYNITRDRDMLRGQSNFDNKVDHDDGRNQILGQRKNVI